MNDILRRTAKQIVEKTLRVVLANPRRMVGRTLILAYHNVVPDQIQGQGDQSLHLAVSDFLRQVDLIQQYGEIRPLADLLAAAPDGGRPQIAITFDDAYRGAVELALPELERRGLPSTVFVAPGLLGCRSFWWDEVASIREGLAGDIRRRALEDHGGRHEAIRAGISTPPLAGALPAYYGCAGEDQLRALIRLGQVTLAAHSWSHPNLARLDADELATELSRPLDWLKATAVATLPVLAYPYGISSPTVALAVERAGYQAGLLVGGGWFTPPASHRWAIPRYNVPAGISDDGFRLRLSGFLLA